MTRHPSPPTESSPAAEIPLSAAGAGGSEIRRLRFLVYGVVLVSSLLQTAIAPLLPSYAHRFQLSGFQTAVLLAATGIAALVVSVPAGTLADRFGARGLTLWAGWLMALATAGQAVAPSYPTLVAARLVFGLGYGMVWTAALAWLANASRDESALAGTVTVSGLGSIVGPAFAGFIAEYLGLAAPFIVAACLMAVLTGMLTTIRAEGTNSVEPISMLASLRTAAADVRVLGATTAVVVAGSTAAVTTLLVPLELHAAGASEGFIGLVFSAAAVLFILGSAATGWFGKRVVRLRTVLAAGLILAVAISPATASSAPLCLVVMLCATATLRSVLWTVGYPLGATGANQSGVGLGVVMGILNGVWALSTVVSPLLAGALLGAFGARATFGITQIVVGAGVMVVWFALRTGGPLRRVLIGSA